MKKSAILIQKVNKNTGNREWALASIKDRSKILKWFGVKKPSLERVKKEEARVQMFKHLRSRVLSKIIPEKEYTLYHGSKIKNLTKLDINFQKSGFYPGIYATSDTNRAKEHGNFIYTLKVKGKFFEFDSKKQEDEMVNDTGTKGSGYPLVKKLEKEGFVGIKRGNEYIIFDPKNIKINPND